MILVLVILPYLLVGRIPCVSSGRSIWESNCQPRTLLLNDCNLCKCSMRGRYQCEQRNCNAVDKFSHFKDAVQEIDVGMEGHGVWRSTKTACTPGVSYKRDGLLCVCDEDGHWPNEVCENVYRVLYTVEQTSLEAVVANAACMPEKLYLAGCNVCFCPSAGNLSPELCTNLNCTSNDPMLLDSLVDESDTDIDIYAPCDYKKKYQLGCRKCTCLKNNRLRCNNCKDGKAESYCDVHETRMFNIECNTCQCDAQKNMYCTSKKCLSGDDEYVSKLINQNHNVDGTVDACEAKKYQSGCSSCSCLTTENGLNIIDCAAKCHNHRRTTIHEDCVNNTVYEMDCQVCSCYVTSGVKRMFCFDNPACRKKVQEVRSRDLQKMHGYCEPLHIYDNDCNRCQCLPDGKTLKCTSKNCDTPQNITISIIPVKLASPEGCEPGEAFNVDCNTCICLLNGNSICTTLDCKKNEP